MHASYTGVLLAASENPGQFLRLSRLWYIVQKDLSERDYKKLLTPILEEHRVDDAVHSRLLDPLAEFTKIVENVKTNSFVHSLQIESFEPTPEWSKDDYSDAIVNIFTRLNTAGRTLTREEITLAWLKVGWLPELTDGQRAGQCLDDLSLAMRDRGLQLETDELVRLISFIWAVLDRQGCLSISKDLLKGEIIRSMAASVATMWTEFKPMIEHGADLIKKRDLEGNQGSFDAIIVFLTWYYLVFHRLNTISASLRLVQRDSLKKTLDFHATEFLDRWVFGSQWANVWGDAAVLNFQTFATDLSEFYVELSGSESDNFILTVSRGTERLMGRVSIKATEQVNISIVRDRRRVHAYFSLLWVWHRLDKDRWKYSTMHMLTGQKRKTTLEVDHTVADALWGRLVNKALDEKLANSHGTDEEKALIAPDEFESTADALAFVNLLGNCTLLHKSFNISKSDQPMWQFWQEVHEFKEKRYSDMIGKRPFH